jgi:hypothetical protein
MPDNAECNAPDAPKPFPRVPRFARAADCRFQHRLRLLLVGQRTSLILKFMNSYSEARRAFVL